MGVNYLDTFAGTAGTHLVTGSPLHVSDSGATYAAGVDAQAGTDAVIAAGGAGLYSAAAGYNNWLQASPVLGVDDAAAITFTWGTGGGGWSLVLSSRGSSTGTFMGASLYNDGSHYMYEFSGDAFAGQIGATLALGAALAAGTSYQWIFRPSGDRHRIYLRRATDGAWLTPGLGWGGFRIPFVDMTRSGTSGTAGSPMIGTAPSGGAELTRAAASAGLLLAGDGGILSATSTSITVEYSAPIGGTSPTTTAYYQDVTAGGSWSAGSAVTPGTPLAFTGLTPGHQYQVKAVASDGTLSDAGDVYSITLPATDLVDSGSVIDTFGSADGTPFNFPGHVSDSGDTWGPIPNDQSAGQPAATIAGHQPYSGLAQDPIVSLASKTLPGICPVRLRHTRTGAATANGARVGLAFGASSSGSGTSYLAGFRCDTDEFDLLTYSAGGLGGNIASWVPTTLIPAGQYDLILVRQDWHFEFYLQRVSDGYYLSPSTTVTFQAGRTPFLKAADVTHQGPSQVGMYLEFPAGFANAPTVQRFDAGSTLLYPGKLGYARIADTYVDLSATLALGGLLPISYTLMRSTSGGAFVPVKALAIDPTNHPDVTYYDTGLTPSTAYQWRVDAVDASGATVSSPVLSKTTLAALPAEVPVTIPAPVTPQTAWTTHANLLDVTGAVFNSRSLSILYCPTTGQFWGAYMHPTDDNPGGSGGTEIRLAVSNDLLNWYDQGQVTGDTVNGTTCNGVYRPSLRYHPTNGYIYLYVHTDAPPPSATPSLSRGSLWRADHLGSGAAGFALFNPLFRAPYLASTMSPHDPNVMVDKYGDGASYLYTTGYADSTAGEVGCCALFNADWSGFVSGSSTDDFEGPAPFQRGGLNYRGGSQESGWSPNPNQCFLGTGPTFDNTVAGGRAVQPAQAIFTTASPPAVGDYTTSYNSQSSQVWRDLGGTDYWMADDNAGGVGSAMKDVWLPIAWSNGLPTVPYVATTVPVARVPSAARTPISIFFAAAGGY